MSLDCYFEDGPMEGKVQAMPDGTPPFIHMKMPKALPKVQRYDGKWDEPMDFPLDIVKIRYRRHHEQLRTGCASYFVDKED